MSLFNVFGIAGSGMSAQSVRMNLTASNLANSQSVATRPEDAYKARHPVFQTVLEDAQSAGVRTSGIIQSDADTEARYTPWTSAGRRQRLRLCIQRQHDGGDGQHDVRIAQFPAKRRSDEHLEGFAVAHAATR